MWRSPTERRKAQGAERRVKKKKKSFSEKFTTESQKVWSDWECLRKVQLLDVKNGINM